MLCVHFYFSIEENRDGQFGAQNCKLYWAHKLVNQDLMGDNLHRLGSYEGRSPTVRGICL
jgi:hypothetical protein